MSDRKVWDGNQNLYMIYASVAPSANLHPAHMAFLDSRQSRARLLIALLAAGLLIALRPFLSGLLGAVVLAVVFEPLYERLRAGGAKKLAAVFTTMVALVLILLPAAWLTGVVVAQGPDALAGLSDNAIFTRLSTLNILGFDVGNQMAQAGNTVARWLSTRVLALLGGAARALLNIVIALLGLYFLLTANTSLWPRFRAMLPFSRSSADTLRDRFTSVTRATLLGIVLTAALQGAVVGLTFWGVGLPRAAFWGVMTAIASILPLFGSGLVWGPGAVILALDNQYLRATILALVGMVVASNIDNVIRPVVYKRISNIHPMVTLVGGFAGVSAFGLMGLLLGPLAIAYFFELLELYDEEYGTHIAPEAPPPDSQ